MKHGQATQAASRPLFAQAVMVMAGLGYTIAGAALLFAPEWFFQNIGYFPPFSRHYAGDVGAFVLPLGTESAFCSRRATHPSIGVTWHRNRRQCVACAQSHVRRRRGQASLVHWLVDTLPLLVLGVLLAIMFRNTAKT